MTKLTWGAPSQRVVHSGIDHVVVYPASGPSPIVWDGVTSIDEAPDGGDLKTTYFEGLASISRLTNFEYSADVSAYTYPDLIEDALFHLAYRTKIIGNNIEYYQIHIVYNIVANLSNASDYKTSAAGGHNPIEFKWRFSASPASVSGHEATDHVIIDTRYTTRDALTFIENTLFGDEHSPRIIMPEELLTIAEQYAILSIIDHGDGTWSASGPDDVLKIHGDGTFTIDSISLRMLSNDSYFVKSY